jgi:hypothetical protein
MGISSQAFASTSGSLTYQFTGFTSNPGCTTAPPSQQQENFTGTVTDAGEGINGDPITFSLCNDPGVYSDGLFSLIDPTDGTISGTFTGVDLSDTFSGGVDHETVQGTFTVTGAVDNGYSDIFVANMAETVSTGAGVGTFVVGTPEPATIALTGFGLILAGIVRKRRAR